MSGRTPIMAGLGSKLTRMWGHGTSGGVQKGGKQCGPDLGWEWQPQQAGGRSSWEWGTDSVGGVEGVRRRSDTF